MPSTVRGFKEQSVYMCRLVGLGEHAAQILTCCNQDDDRNDRAVSSDSQL